MINNNPYNVPDVPIAKTNRIYADSTVGVYRQESYESMNSPRSTNRGMGRNSSFKG